MILDEINKYYTSRILEHGPSPKGADWNGEASQRTRFDQLMKLVGEEESLSVNDLGCGYGAFLDYLYATGKKPDYLGVDISEEMIKQGIALHEKKSACRLIVAPAPDRVADYTVASGIFNVRLKTVDEAWRTYMGKTLDAMRQSSAKGFAFNCLTSYSDATHMRDYLFYADPREWFDYCKQHYSKNVALLHDYGLYEFTLIVRL